MRAKLLTGGGLLLALLSTPLAAQDISAGRLAARQCAGCHGQLGLAEIPNAPNLAGESSLYITAQLKAFRDGVRVHDQMSIIAEGLSEQDISDLAAWFAAIKVTVTAPEIE